MTVSTHERVLPVLTVANALISGRGFAWPILNFASLFFDSLDLFDLSIKIIIAIEIHWHLRIFIRTFHIENPILGLWPFMVFIIVIYLKEYFISTCPRVACGMSILTRERVSSSTYIL